MASITPREGLRGTTYRVRFYDSSGTQRSRTFKTRKAAERFAVASEADRDRGSWLDPNLANTSYREWALYYLSSKVNLKPKTLDSYTAMVTNHVLPTWGDLALADIRPRPIQAWVHALTAEMAAKTVRYVYMVFRASLRMAVEQNYLHQNPCRGVSLPRVVQAPPVVLAITDVHRLANAVPGHYHHLIYFLAYSGARWGEAAGLRRRALNGTRVLIDEALSERRGHLYRETPKNHRPRMIAVPPFLGLALEERMSGASAGDPVFTTENGNLLRNSNFRRKIWLPALEKTGLQLRIHDLRHTCASLLIGQGANPKAVQQQLGHHTVAFTLDRYGHLFGDELVELASRMERLHMGVRIDS